MAVEKYFCGNWKKTESHDFLLQYCLFGVPTCTLLAVGSVLYRHKGIELIQKNTHKRCIWRTHFAFPSASFLLLTHVFTTSTTCAAIVPLPKHHTQSRPFRLRPPHNPSMEIQSQDTKIMIKPQNRKHQLRKCKSRPLLPIGGTQQKATRIRRLGSAWPHHGRRRSIRSRRRVRMAPISAHTHNTQTPHHRRRRLVPSVFRLSSQSAAGLRAKGTINPCQPKGGGRGFPPFAAGAPISKARNERKTPAKRGERRRSPTTNTGRLALRPLATTGRPPSLRLASPRLASVDRRNREAKLPQDTSASDCSQQEQRPEDGGGGDSRTTGGGSDTIGSDRIGTEGTNARARGARRRRRPIGLRRLGCPKDRGGEGGGASFWRPPKLRRRLSTFGSICWRREGARNVTAWCTYVSTPSQSPFPMCVLLLTSKPKPSPLCSCSW